MPYIAFVDMIGTRSAAMISNEEYTDAINDFNNSIKQVSSFCQCKVYGYSDNAYIQIETLSDMIMFFRILRDTLMNKHRYFTAAVDRGSLDAERVSMPNAKGFSMKFTAPSTVDIYMQQCVFSGIGISLSQKVVEDLQSQGMQIDFCQSVFQKSPINNSGIETAPFYDLSYNSVILEKLQYIVSDYLITAAINERASRYYITPVVSMIKCLDKNILIKNLDDIISLLSFKTVPEAFRNLSNNRKYSLCFLFALIEFTLSLREKDKSIDATKICERVVKGYDIEHNELVTTLPSISTAIISNAHKHQFLNIVYNMRNQKIDV